MKRFALWALAKLILCLSAGLAGAAGEPLCTHAVVRLASAGCSGTIIYTAKDKTYILTCAHAFQGQDRNKKLLIDIPHCGNPPKQVGPARVVDVQLDERRGIDCTLIFLPAGPFPYCAPVAPAGWKPGHVWSVGYRRMVKTSVKVPNTLLTISGGVQYTRERPVPGDSGGGLIDADAGYLIGTTIGYEVRPNGRGMYTSLDVVRAFMARTEALPSPRAPPRDERKKTGVSIAANDRVPNRTGSQCVWSSAETLARYLKIARLYDLTDRYGSTAGPGDLAGILKSRRVRFRQQGIGSKDLAMIREALAQGLPCLVGIEGRHALVVSGLNDDGATIIDNGGPRALKDQTWSLKTFAARWDGWVCVLLPDGSDGAGGQRPAQEKNDSFSRRLA